MLEIYQKRLSQVTENLNSYKFSFKFVTCFKLSHMHSELLELNDYLLKENRLKTKLNERLKLELISLRGPVRFSECFIWNMYT